MRRGQRDPRGARGHAQGAEASPHEGEGRGAFPVACRAAHIERGLQVDKRAAGHTPTQACVGTVCNGAHTRPDAALRGPWHVERARPCGAPCHAHARCQGPRGGRRAEQRATPAHSLAVSGVGRSAPVPKAARRRTPQRALQREGRRDSARLHVRPRPPWCTRASRCVHAARALVLPCEGRAVGMRGHVVIAPNTRPRAACRASQQRTLRRAVATRAKRRRRIPCFVRLTCRSKCRLLLEQTSSQLFFRSNVLYGEPSGEARIDIKPGRAPPLWRGSPGFQFQRCAHATGRSPR